MQSTLDSNKRHNITACSIIDHIPDIFIMIDQDGDIVMVNAVIRQILGWEQHEVLGAKMEILMPPEFRSTHHLFREQLFQHHDTRNMNQRVNLTAWHKQGYAVPVDIKLSFSELAGELYGIAVIRDATNQRQLQNELKDKNEKQQKLLEEKNYILGMAAHDMRNPIGVIQNFSQILLAGSIGPLNDDQIEFVKRIGQSSSFMMGLLEDFLEMSAIESGTMHLHREEFPVNDLINDVLLSNRIHAREKSIELDVINQAKESVSLNADKRKLYQVLHNLVDNAIKYSPKHSQVTLRCNLIENEFVFSVKDQGVGIAKDDQEKLFMPFFRAKNKPTGGEKSTGLGLFISKRIVEAHRGRLTLESENGKGSQFFVHIPLRAIDL